MLVVQSVVLFSVERGKCCLSRKILFKELNAAIICSLL